MVGWEVDGQATEGLGATEGVGDATEGVGDALEGVGVGGGRA